VEECQEEPQRLAENALLFLHLPCKLARGTEHNHARQASPPHPGCAQSHTLDLAITLAFAVLVVLPAHVVSIALVDCIVVHSCAIFITVCCCCSRLCTLVTVTIPLVVLTLFVALAVVVVTAS
jgi:hypothetical protein